MNLKKLERYLPVNLLGPGPRLIKKGILPGRGLTKVEKHWSKAQLCCCSVTGVVGSNHTECTGVSLLFLSIERSLCIDMIASIDICSQTQILIFVLLRRVSTQLVLTTTCFGRYIGHHQVVKKSKGHPATGRGGPRGSGQIKAPDFLDVSALLGSQVVSQRHRPPLSKKKSLVLTFRG